MQEIFIQIGNKTLFSMAKCLNSNMKITILVEIWTLVQRVKSLILESNNIFIHKKHIPPCNSLIHFMKWIKIQSRWGKKQWLRRETNNIQVLQSDCDFTVFYLRGWQIYMLIFMSEITGAVKSTEIAKH